MLIKDPEIFMKQALSHAELAAKIGEVPVGAIIVCDGKVIAEAHNQVEKDVNACAHAEILAIKIASKKRGSWRLEGCSIFVTLEPCSMCAGAILNSRISEVYFGASDEKSGACGSLYDLLSSSSRADKIKVYRNVLADQSVKLLQEFFSKKR